MKNISGKCFRDSSFGNKSKNFTPFTNKQKRQQNNNTTTRNTTHNTTQHNTTQHNSQDKTRQDKTRQDKTRQDARHNTHKLSEHINKRTKERRNKKTQRHTHPQRSQAPATRDRPPTATTSTPSKPTNPQETREQTESTLTQTTRERETHRQYVVVCYCSLSYVARQEHVEMDLLRHQMTSQLPSWTFIMTSFMCCPPLQSRPPSILRTSERN